MNKLEEKKIATILLGYNDSQLLPAVMMCLKWQSHPTKIVYIDDASTDDSMEIAKFYKADVTNLLRRGKRLYEGFPILDTNVNRGLECLQELGDLDYFMIMPSDVVFKTDYIERMLKKFYDDDYLVIASGQIESEPTKELFPRGAGRIYDKRWFDDFIVKFPHNFIWESYPVYKALSMHYHTRGFRDVHMMALRPTRLYKPLYGYAMKQLGYNWWYALGRCGLAFLKNPMIGYKMLRTYLKDTPVHDSEVAAWLRNYQKEYIRKKLKYW